MGPTCEILLSANPDGTTLDAIEAFMSQTIQDLIWTVKGRHWQGSVTERPLLVSVKDSNGESPATVCLVAACNAPEDYDILRKLAKDLTSILGAKVVEVKIRD